MDAEPKIILEGDEIAAAQYIRFGLKCLAELKHRMKFSERMGYRSLFQDQRTIQLPGGGNVYVNAVGELSQVRIFMPPEEGEEKIVPQRGPYVVVTISAGVGIKSPANIVGIDGAPSILVFDVPTNKLAENIPRNADAGGGVAVFPCALDEISHWWNGNPGMWDYRGDSSGTGVLSNPPGIDINWCPFPHPGWGDYDNPVTYECEDVNGNVTEYQNIYYADSGWVPSPPVPTCSDYTRWASLDVEEGRMHLYGGTAYGFISYDVRYNFAAPDDGAWYYDRDRALISASEKYQHASGYNEEDVQVVCVYGGDPPSLQYKSERKAGEDNEENYNIFKCPLGTATHRLTSRYWGRYFYDGNVANYVATGEYDTNQPKTGITGGDPDAHANWNVAWLQILREDYTQAEIAQMKIDYPIPDPPYYIRPSGFMDYTTDGDYMFQLYAHRMMYANQKGEREGTEWLGYGYDNAYDNIVWGNYHSDDDYKGYMQEHYDVFAAVNKIDDFRTYNFKEQPRNPELERQINLAINRSRDIVRPHLTLNEYEYISWRVGGQLVGIDPTLV